MIEFKVPEVGENIESGTVVSIMVNVGDAVTKDQDLFELETEKASLPVPCPTDGVIKEILLKVGDEVKIGQVVMKIDGDASASETPKQAEAPEAAPAPTQAAPSAPTPPPAAPATPAPQPIAAAQNTTIVSHGDVAAAPSVRRFARELGINLQQVRGTGPAGRISKDDVKAFTKQLVTTGLAQQPAAAASKPLPDFSKWGEVDRKAMTKIRKVTAEHLSYCWQSIPHVTQFGKADITELEKARKQHSTADRKLTVTPFILKIMAQALKEFPQFNASIDMDTHEIIYKKYFNIGVAVDTENGLLVPVLRDLDQKSIFQINDEVTQIAEKTRNRKVSLEDLKGGSMTLTNLGGIGGTNFTPIVNWPEVAILGLARGGFEPIYQKDQDKFVPRLMLPLSLSYDHRIIDGADGARFIRWVCEAIEQAHTMKLD